MHGHWSSHINYKTRSPLSISLLPWIFQLMQPLLVGMHIVFPNSEWNLFKTILVNSCNYHTDDVVCRDYFQVAINQLDISTFLSVDSWILVNQTVKSTTSNLTSKKVVIKKLRF